MINNSISKNGILIRLTEERWNHILNNHSELIDYKSEVLKTKVSVLFERIFVTFCWKLMVMIF